MNSAEAKQILAVLNSSWPGKPLDPVAARMWGSKLLKHDAVAVMRVIDTLMETEEWRPILAQILKLLTSDPEVKSASAAFEAVWSQVSKRPPQVSALEQRAVDRLGGWGVLRGWLIDERHWHAKRFEDVYSDLLDEERNRGLRAVAAGEQRAIGDGRA